VACNEIANDFQYIKNQKRKIVSDDKSKFKITDPLPEQSHLFSDMFDL